MKLKDFLISPESEGKEKHVPVIELARGEETVTVTVSVGKEIAHPNTAAHHIAWVEVYGVNSKDLLVELGRATFGATFTRPQASFTVPAGAFKAFGALSFCNIHGVWENLIEA